MSTMLRESLVAPEGCHISTVSLGAGWEAWDRIVAGLRAAGVEVRDTVHVVESTYWPSGYAQAFAHYEDGAITVSLFSPILEFDEAGAAVLLPEEVLA